MHTFAGQIFDHTQVRHFRWRHESDGHAFIAGTACTANTVNVRFWVLTDIIVVDVSHTGNIQAPRRHVSRYQELYLTLTEGIDDASPLLLRNVTVDEFSIVAAQAEAPCHFVNPLLSTAEDDGLCWHLNIQEASEDVKLLVIPAFDEELFNQVSGHLLGFNLDVSRFLKELIC